MRKQRRPDSLQHRDLLDPLRNVEVPISRGDVDQPGVPITAVWTASRAGGPGCSSSGAPARSVSPAGRQAGRQAGRSEVAPVGAQRHVALDELHFVGAKRPLSLVGPVRPSDLHVGPGEVEARCPVARVGLLVGDDRRRSGVVDLADPGAQATVLEVTVRQQLRLWLAPGGGGNTLRDVGLGASVPGVVVARAEAHEAARHCSHDRQDGGKPFVCPVKAGKRGQASGPVGSFRREAGGRRLEATTPGSFSLRSFPTNSLHVAGIADPSPLPALRRKAGTSKYRHLRRALAAGRLGAPGAVSKADLAFGAVRNP